MIIRELLAVYSHGVLVCQTQNSYLSAVDRDKTGRMNGAGQYDRQGSMPGGDLIARFCSGLYLAVVLLACHPALLLCSPSNYVSNPGMQDRYCNDPIPSAAGS